MKRHLMWINLFFTVISVLIWSCGEQEDTSDKLNPGGQEEVYDLKVSTMHIRDPFILADPETKTYYMHANDNKSFKVFKSKDLVNWKSEGKSFTPQTDFWGQQDFWAPDVYHYKGKYYLFATFSSSVKKRGTSILVSDKAVGPFVPLINQAITLDNKMCLDGSLFIDKINQPWIIYSHEWLEVIDGEVVAQRLSEDLTKTEGDPVTLFKATEAAWVGAISSNGVTGYVTDAPFIHQLANGELLMLWSSFAKNGKYSIGVARSKSGSVTGPWEQMSTPINSDDGGHAMLFTDFKGRLMISYHAPNSLTERPQISEVYINNGNIVISN